MAALSQTINNVLGGVSQQPDPVKLPGQVREANNAYLDPTFGCRKRPGTQFIAKLSDTIPEDAIWIPIFRDDLERYVACIYQDPTDGTTIKVWTADSGEERTVTLRGDSLDYISTQDSNKLKYLTINDYTFLVNGEKVVTMSSDDTGAAEEEALVVVNQVAYNTNYAIDFLKDGDQSQEKVYKAAKLDIAPGSFSEADEGVCNFADAESFVVDGSDQGLDASKVGLSFRIEAQCDPTLITEEEEGLSYPTSVIETLPVPGMQIFYTSLGLGSPDDYAVGSYAYAQVISDSGNLTLRLEAQVGPRFIGAEFGNRFDSVSAQIVSYRETMNFVQGQTETVSSGGYTARYRISTVNKAPSTPTYRYESKYKVNVSLKNGGINWREGDVVTATMAGKEYTITVTEEAFTFGFAAEATVSYTTPSDLESGTLSVQDIVANLASEIVDLDNYDASPVGNVIYIKRTDGRAFNFTVRGGAADTALIGIKDSVQDISVLPAQGIAGMTLKVKNTSDSDADDYFVKFITEGGIPGQGFWEETVSPGIPTTLNSSTMPHVLVGEDDGTFTIRPLTKEYDEENYWVARDVGDKETNPPPTFVDKTIKDCFFYMNRLGILSEDTVVLSQAGDYFNFFQGSSIAVSDADPIDMAASSTKPAKLKAALGTPAGLLLFAENSQFLMETEDVAFGPSTVKMREITNYSYNSDVEPVETGVSVLFTTSAETYTKVFELSTDSLQARALVSENTRIIPEYIPPNLKILESSPNSSLVLMGNGDKFLYVFKFYNTGNERNFAGWTKWEMSTPIKMVHFNHDTGYFIGYNSSGQSILSRMELIDDPDTSPISAFGTNFTPRLDHYLFQEEVVTADLANGKTRVTVPDGFRQEDKTVFLVATFQGTETFYSSGDLQLAGDGTYYVDIDNNILNSEFIIGLGYTMEVVLPSFYLKSGDNNQADRRNPPMVENVYLELYYSGRYQAKISKLGYTDRSIDLDTAVADIYLANTAAIELFATKAVPVYSRGDIATVTISAPDPLPASLTSYSWEGHYSTRGIKAR